MNKWILSAAVALLGVTLAIPEVEARRLGGGRSVGTQRNVTPAPKAPAQQQQAAPAQQNPAAAPAAPGSRWGALLGGLALGGLIGYLFGGEGLLGFLMLALLGAAAVAVLAAILRRRAAEAPQPMQFAGMGGQTLMPPPAGGVAPASTRVPADFDSAGFLRGAKQNFLKLQLANDRRELDAIREFATDEVFAQLEADVLARAGTQQTDIVSLEAELLELVEENGRFWASVRFSGMEREAPASAPAAFEEVWNLVKPADGSSGWLLAGIQQMH